MELRNSNRYQNNIIIRDGWVDRNEVYICGGFSKASHIVYFSLLDKDFKNVKDAEIIRRDNDFNIIFKYNQRDKYYISWNDEGHRHTCRIPLDKYIKEAVDLRKQNIRKKRSLKYINSSRIYNGAKAFLKEGAFASFDTLTCCETSRIGDLYTKRNSLEKRVDKKGGFEYNPLVSIVIPLYNTDLKYLEILMESIVGQTYDNWQLCLSDASSDDRVCDFLTEKYLSDNRILYKKAGRSLGISENTNEAVNMSTGEYVLFFDHDDVMSFDALWDIVTEINKDSDIEAIYTDEDKINSEGELFDPAFKPDFDIDMLRSTNYICHIFAAKRKLLDAVSQGPKGNKIYCRKEFDGAQDYDLVLRCAEKAKKIGHVSKVLAHWRMHEASTAGNPKSKLYAFEAGRKAVEEHYKRMGITAKVGDTAWYGRYRSILKIKGEPSVVVVLLKDKEEKYKKVIRNIKDITSYNNYDIVVTESYNRMLSHGNRESEAYYVFMDVNGVITHKHWIQEMLMYCSTENTGIVGTKILDSSGKIINASYVLGMRGYAMALGRGEDRHSDGYMVRNNMVHGASGVSGMLMMCRKSVFDRVGGFDEGYKDILEDMDLCLKAAAKGYKTVYTPYPDIMVRNYKYKKNNHDIKYFKEKWKQEISNGDRYYNKNLSLLDPGFSLRRRGEIPEGQEFDNE